MKPRSIYEFGPFRLDATARVLLRDDQPVHLPRKAVETLLALVENPGQVVTREELMATVWPDRVVDDANLAQNIAVVRKAIGVVHGEPGSIETFPGRGYRILGPVRIGVSGALAAPPLGGGDISGPGGAAGTAAASRGTEGGRGTSVLAARLAGGGAETTAAAARLAGNSFGAQGGTAVAPRIVGTASAAPVGTENSSGAPNGVENIALAPLAVASAGAIPSPPRASANKVVLVATAALVAAVGSFAFVLPFTRNGATVAPAGLHRVPVTRLAGAEHQPAISPDGKAVAFVWESPGEAEPGVWVQYAWETSPRRVTTEPGTYTSPAWSPDGRRLAFLRFRNSTGAVMIGSPDGGPMREIATVFQTRYHLPYRHLDWSPDGRSLVLDDAAASREPLAIHLLSLDSGEKRRLTRPDDMIVGDVDPRFSPDGREVSFIRMFHRAHQEIFRLNLANGAVTQMTADKRRVTGQDWMPDGKTLVFGSDRGGEYRLWKREAGRAREPQLRQAAIYGDFPIQLSLARSAPALVYSILNQDQNIWRLDLTAAPNASGRWLRAVASSGLDASPQFSPQADRVSFRSDRSGEEQLWVSDIDGGNAAQITRRGLRPSVGRWSPDGRSIVFNDASTREIFLARLGADGAWNIAALRAAGIHPVFSPDGKWIYAGGDESIVRYPAAGGDAVEVVKTRGISLGMSPGGEYVYFVKDPSASQLWRVRVTSGRVELVLDGLVPYCSSCWAPARNGIYYLSAEKAVPDRQVLRFLNLETHKDTVVLNYPEPLNPMGSGPFSLSPDGRYLLCVRAGDANADVFRVEPFR